MILGEPSERTAVSVEETIRREYERWMVGDESAEESADDELDDAGSPERGGEE